LKDFVHVLVLSALLKFWMNLYEIVETTKTWFRYQLISWITGRTL